MTATKKEIMVNAWKIAKEGQKTFGGKASEYFAQALKINIERSGHMEVDHYKTGNICFASVDGEEISHRFAGQILSVKCFIDLKNDNKLVVQYGGPEAREVVENVVKKVLA